jgi:hypothetical protein
MGFPAGEPGPGHETGHGQPGPGQPGPGRPGPGSAGPGPGDSRPAGADSPGAGSPGPGFGLPAAARPSAPERARVPAPPPPPQTGNARVDEALSRLDGLAETPVAEHPAVFEYVHDRLAEALGDLDVGGHPGPDGQPGSGR